MSLKGGASLGKRRTLQANGRFTINDDEDRFSVASLLDDDSLGGETDDSDWIGDG